MEYLAVCVEDRFLHEVIKKLNAEVNKLIDYGWRPHGGPCLLYQSPVVIALQALVREVV